MTATSMPPAQTAGQGLPTVIDLGDVRARDEFLVGTKAAGLARLLRAGFAVPPGFVITGTANLEGSQGAEIVQAAHALSPGPLAVRSSAINEDLADASYAGQYETLLGVEGGEALLAAVAQVRASGSSVRVAAYRDAHDQPAQPLAIAVLVQPMLAVDSAGVAFTADPLSGDRQTTIVTAVRGLGDRLASGEVTPDEWVIRDDVATARRNDGQSLSVAQVLAVAELARSIEAEAGVAQDIEWAVVGDDVFVLQARPMTALPEPTAWEPGHPGIWLRNFRFGEWLGDPVTPLFESWALDQLEGRLHANYSAWLGGIPFRGPAHVVLNGWYYYGGLNAIPAQPRPMLAAFVRYILPSLLRRPRRVAMAMPPTAKFGIELFYREWREQIQPRYRRAVAEADLALGASDARGLVALVDDLLNEAGDYFTYLTAVGGFAVKAEIPFARFYRRELMPLVGGSHLDLLTGLGDERPRRAGHAVHTLDWFEPLPADVESEAERSDAAVRHARAREARLDAEKRARSALSGNRSLLGRFERLLSAAQRFGRAREEQAAEFTLAWPLLRRAVLQLGQHLVEQGLLAKPDEVFFLTRLELAGAVDGGSEVLSVRALRRRQSWHGQRALSPPLQLGTIPSLFQRMLDDAILALRGPDLNVGDVLVGIPASAGRASGAVRVVRSTADFERVVEGDVLVASMTTPAWTPLFGRIVALVTDNGGVGAHASIVAREYALPAVVGTGDATSKLADGELIEVDGSAGTVRRIAKPTHEPGWDAAAGVP